MNKGNKKFKKMDETEQRILRAGVNAEFVPKSSEPKFETKFRQFKELFENYVESLETQDKDNFLKDLKERKILREKVTHTKMNYGKTERCKFFI